MCDVHKTERAVHGPFSARLWSVQYPFESRFTSVLLKRSGVKRTVHGRVFLLHTVLVYKLTCTDEQNKDKIKHMRIYYMYITHVLCVHTCYVPS